jgi:hypothetical protein
MRHGHLRTNPARTVSAPAPLHSDLPTGLPASTAIAAAIGFSSIVTLLILPVNLKGTACDQATAVPAPETISAPSSAEKGYWTVSGHLCRCGLLRCDESHRQRRNSYLEERVSEFPELIQSVRSLQPAQSPEVHTLYAPFFLGSDRGCNCQK